MDDKRKVSGKLTTKRKAELKQLASDYVAGQVFGSWQVGRAEEVGMVFMVLAFMQKKDAQAMLKRGVVHFCEYLSKAGPGSVNGMPMFMSCRTLTKDDFEFFKLAAMTLQEAQRAALKAL